MRRFYTAESVTEGHPDKVCDQIADAILDECLRYDPSSRVACEVLATRGNVFVAGEISSGYEPPVFDVIRKVLEECGYCTDGIEMDTFVHQQSPDIAKAVSVSKEFRDNIGAKLRDFIVTAKCFRKFFLKKFFFRNFHKRRDVHPPQVLSVLAPLAPLR